MGIAADTDPGLCLDCVLIPNAHALLSVLYPETCAGGKLVVQYRTKTPSAPKCPVTGKAIQGVSIFILFLG